MKTFTYLIECIDSDGVYTTRSGDHTQDSFEPSISGLCREVESLQKRGNKILSVFATIKQEDVAFMEELIDSRQGIVEA